MLFPLLPTHIAMEMCSTSRHVVMNIRRALLMWEVPTVRCWAKGVFFLQNQYRNFMDKGCSFELHKENRFNSKPPLCTDVECIQIS
jgi:hypothetical protein